MAMKNASDGLSEQDEIEMLLPWYVTGRLQAEDAARVEAYLAGHPQMRARLDLSRAEHRETAFLNAPPAAPSPAEVERFIAGLSAKPGGAARRGAHWRQRAAAWAETAVAALYPPEAGWMRIAAALVMLIQAALIVALLATRPSGPYEVAHGAGGEAAAGTYALVRLTDAAPVAALADVMAEWELSIVSGPKAGGLFTLRIGPAQMSEADRDRLMARLRTRSDLFSFVTPTR
jgi:anti-sigma factor RsiW